MSRWRTTSAALVGRLTACAVLVSLPGFAADAPTAGSPGGSTTFPIVSGPCPTFSWSDVEGAQGYEIALYGLAENGGVEPAPRLRQSIFGSFTSWTPPSALCPEPGKRYAWMVRASVDGTETEWSGSRFFRVSEAPSIAEVEEALEVLRRYAGQDLDAAPAGAPLPGRQPSVGDLPRGTSAHRPAGAGIERPQQPTREVDGVHRERETPKLGRAQLAGALSADAPSSQTVTLSPDYSLGLESDLAVQGHIFKEGYPLLHTEGGFGGGNTAVGLDALVSVTPVGENGEFNSALGRGALRNNTEGRVNTAVGALALYSNTTGDLNSASGAFALTSNTSGSENTASGAGTLYSNTTGHSNTAVGAFALEGNTDGIFNTANGATALRFNTTGDSNTAMGFAALEDNTQGAFNTANGSRALEDNTTGNWNTAIGRSALANNTSGGYNTASGFGALLSNTEGDSNTAVGARALRVNTAGTNNLAVGKSALSYLTAGSRNTAIGPFALAFTETGFANIAIGSSAGSHLDVGSDNIYIGNDGDSEFNTIRIGDDDVHEAFFVAGVRGTTVGGGIPVLVGGVGRLGTVTSSRRFKEAIEDMGGSTTGLLALRPVTFRYTKDTVADGPRPIEFGLIAEEVAEVYPDLVAYDEQGRPYSVRYHVLPAMLLNEMQRLERELRQLRRSVRTLSGGSRCSDD